MTARMYSSTYMVILHVCVSAVVNTYVCMYDTIMFELQVNVPPPTN